MSRKAWLGPAGALTPLDGFRGGSTRITAPHAATGPTIRALLASGSPASQQTYEITLPTFEAGDTVLVHFRIGSSDSPTLSLPAGWTVKGSRDNSGTSRVITREMLAADPATITVSQTDGDRGCAWTAYSLPTALDVSAAVGGSEQTLSPGWAQTLWIAGVSARFADGSFGQPAGYGDFLTDWGGNVENSGFSARAASAHRITTASSETPGAWTIDPVGGMNSFHHYTIGVRLA